MSTDTTLVIESGELSFEEGLRVAIASAAKRDGGTPASFLDTLATILDNRAWEKLTDRLGKPLTLRRFLFDPPPDGAGLNEDDFRRLITLRHRWERDNQALHDRIEWARTQALEILNGPLSEHGGKREKGQVDNINLKGGDSEDYVRRRLRRDNEPLYDQVVAGELSAHAAAIAAGFRKPTKTVPVDTPDAAIRALARRFDKTELRRAVEALP